MAKGQELFPLPPKKERVCTELEKRGEKEKNTESKK
jgi:hypothetical protein